MGRPPPLTEMTLRTGEQRQGSPVRRPESLICSERVPTTVSRRARDAEGAAGGLAHLRKQMGKTGAQAQPGEPRPPPIAPSKRAGDAPKKRSKFLVCSERVQTRTSPVRVEESVLYYRDEQDNWCGNRNAGAV